MTAKVLVVGASGLVGNALLNEFEPHCRTVGTFCQNALADLIHLDLRDPREVRSVLERVCPDIVLCPAANPNVEFCEADPVATRQVNVDGLQNLLTAIGRTGVLLVYFSSDYVFDGNKGVCSETDECNPLNEYGRQKLECEQRIAAQLDSYIIGRISGVYGWEKERKNFVVRFIESLESGQPFKVPCDQIVTPTYAPNLAQVVHRLVQSGQSGLFHISGPLPLLRTEFAQLIVHTFDLDVSLVRPVPTANLELRAVRPLAAGLRVDKVRTLLGFPIAGPREGLTAMRRERYYRVPSRSLAPPTLFRLGSTR